MARGRMLNQKIAEDIEFNGMSIDAQFLFMRTIPFLDRDGLINGHPALLFGRTIPLMPDFAARIPAIVDEWIQSGMVTRYVDGKTTVLFFSGFANNQANMRYDREGKSEFAPPPGYRRTETGLIEVEPSQPVGDTLPDDGGEEKATPQPSAEQLRTNSGVSPEQLPYKDKDQYKDQEESKTKTIVPPMAVVVDCGSVFRLWENNMPGSLTPIITEELGELVDTYGVPEVELAINLAVKANKRNVRYVRGILVKRAEGDDRKKAAPTVPIPVGVSGDLGFSMNTVRQSAL